MEQRVPTHDHVRRLGALLLTGLLAGCSAPAPSPPPAPQATRAAPAPARDLLAEVRAAGRGDDALDVQPLRDPAAEDWRRIAERHERAGELEQAEAALQKALQAAPEDPELLQHAAEIALARGDLDEAERRAWSAFEKGPQLGPLCRRNWAAIRLARELRGNVDAAAAARQQAERCAHQPPLRM